MLAVEPVGLDGAEEELRAVGVWAGVGHGENAWASVLEREVLVGELFAVDRLAAGTVTLGEVTALAHEVCDHSVERGSGKAEADVPRLGGRDGWREEEGWREGRGGGEGRGGRKWVEVGKVKKHCCQRVGIITFHVRMCTSVRG